MSPTDDSFYDEAGLTEAHAAIAEEDVEWLGMIVDADAAAIERQAKFSGVSPLLAATKQQWKQGALLLLAKGADPLATAHDGMTAASVATLTPQLEVLKAMLANGLDPNHISGVAAHSGATLTTLAARKWATQALRGRTAIQTAVEMLVDAGGSLDHQDIHGRTPLHYAIFASSHDAAYALIELGATATEDRMEIDPIALAKHADSDDDNFSLKINAVAKRSHINKMMNAINAGRKESPAPGDSKAGALDSPPPPVDRKRFAGL